MRRKLIYVLLAIAVGGGAFSIAHGQTRRRAIGTPYRPPAVFPISGMNLFPLPRVTNVRIAGNIQIATSAEVSELIQVTRSHDGFIPVIFWRSRYIGQQEYLCNAVTLLIPDRVGSTPFNLDASAYFKAGDLVGVEARSYHMTLSISDNGKTIQYQNGDYYPPIIYNFTWLGGPILDCSK